MPVVPSTSQPEIGSAPPSSPISSPESLKQLIQQFEDLRRKNEELERQVQENQQKLEALKKQEAEQRQRSKRPRSDSDEDTDDENSQPSNIASSSSSTQPPAKKSRPKDISKRMRDFYNSQKNSRPELELPVWESAHEGYMRILSTIELRNLVAESDRKKMANSLSKLEADKLHDWCVKNLFLVDQLTEKSLSAIKRLLTDQQQTKDFAILGVTPTFIGHVGGLCQLTGLFFAENTCIVDPRDIRVQIGIPNQQMVDVTIETAGPTRVLVALPPCPFQFPLGERTISVVLEISVRKEVTRFPFSYILLSSFDFYPLNIDHSPSEEPSQGQKQQGAPRSSDNGGSQSPSSSSSSPSSSSPTISGGQGKSISSSTIGRQNIFGQLELHRVAFEGKLKRVDEILNETPDDVIVKDNFGRTPAHYAAFSVEKRILRHLFRAGGSKFTKDYWGLTPADIYTSQVAIFPRMKPDNINDLFSEDEMTQSEDEDEETTSTDARKTSSPPVSPSVGTKLAAKIIELLRSESNPPPSPSLGSTNDLRKIVSRTNSGDASSGAHKTVTTGIKSIVAPFKGLNLTTNSHSCPLDY